MESIKIIRRIIFILSIVLILVDGCKSQNVKFNFSGKKVLYSDNIDGKTELVLRNIDTNEELRFSNFDDIEGTTYKLFDGGKKIFVNEYNSSGKVYIYNVLKDEKTVIDIHSKNRDMSDFYNVDIRNNKFYFSSNYNIFSHSLNDYAMNKKYDVDSSISQFSVHDDNLIAVTFHNFDMATKVLSTSYIYLYNFKDNSKKEIPYRAYLYGWSKNGAKLLFNSVGPKIMDYPSFEIHSLSIDSLNIFRKMLFIDSNEIIFSGYTKDGNYASTNLYLLILDSKTIIQLTNSNSEKEIKSTSY